MESNAGRGRSEPEPRMLYADDELLFVDGKYVYKDGLGNEVDFPPALVAVISQDAALGYSTMTPKILEATARMLAKSHGLVAEPSPLGPPGMAWRFRLKKKSRE